MILPSIFQLYLLYADIWNLEFFQKFSECTIQNLLNPIHKVNLEVERNSDLLFLQILLFVVHPMLNDKYNNNIVIN